jgi:HK97 family phage portal protein
MKSKLPLIGEIRTGKDAKTRTYTRTVEKPVEKILAPELGAGFLDLGEKGLSGEKDISTRLIKSFYSWVYANVSVLAEEISKVEFELYRVVLVKGEAEYQPISQSPFLDLLDRPNPFTTTSQLIYNTAAHLELTGDAFWLLDKPQNPTQIFVLQPDKVTVTPGDQTKGYLIEKYTYKDTINGKVVEQDYPPELIIHHKTPNPGNPYRGKSVVEAAALSIDNSNLAREFLKMFFTNGAVPNFALSSDQRITDDDIKRITAMLKRTYGGVRNAFKTMILGGGLKPVSVQQTGQQMQLLELITAMRDEIMAMFKNTKASLGIVEDVNRANAEASLNSWKDSVVKPKMMRITDTINEFLLPKFGSNMMVGFEDPVPENRSDDLDEIVKLMNTNVRQVMSVNEAREALGLEQLGPEYDLLDSTPVAPAAAPAMPKALQNISYKRIMRQNKIDEYIQQQKHLFEAAKLVARKLIRKEAPGQIEDGHLPARDYHNYSFAEANEYWSKLIRITQVREKRFEDKMDNFLQEIENKAISNLHRVVPKASKHKAFELFDSNDEVQAGINLFTPLALEIAELSASEAYQLLNLSTLYNPTQNLHQKIAISVNEMTNSIISTDKDKLTSILEAGVQAGKSIPQIASDIREQFGEFRKNQSTKIARTELLRYSNAGQLDAFKASGVVEGKQWYTARDGRVDEECAALDGQIISLGSDFFETSYGSGQQPPLHPNCRCVLLPVLVDHKSYVVELKEELEQANEYIKQLEKASGIDE